MTWTELTKKTDEWIEWKQMNKTDLTIVEYF